MWTAGFRQRLTRTLAVSGVALVMLIGISGTVRAQAPGGTDAIAYSVEIVDDGEASLSAEIRKASRLESLRNEPPRTLAGLRRRTDEDVERIRAVLRAQGFYASAIRTAVDSSATLAGVRVVIETGPLYLLGEFRVRYVDGLEPDSRIDDFDALDLHLGMPADAETVVAAQDRLLRNLGRNGHPFAKVVNRKVVVDHAETLMLVDVTVDPGPSVRFGTVEFRGLKTVKESYLARLVPWRRGAGYDQRLVDDFRRRLWNTDLFGTVSVDPLRPPGDGEAPIVVEVDERPHRTISVSASYSRDRGPGGDVSWEHRNLLGRNERLRLTAASDLVEQRLSMDFREPHFRVLDQAAIFNATGKRKDSDAFQERTLAVFGGLERAFAEHWSVRFGPSVDYSVLTDNDGRNAFVIVGHPVTATRDSTNSALDPTKGSRLTMGMTPSLGMLERTIPFFTTDISVSGYLAAMSNERVVLAARARLASILGSDTEDIPASKRLYAGGGGSVRGYGFQMLGPVDAENDPLGGRSAVEVGFETRLRLTDSIGIVPFIEGGEIYDQALPQFDQNLRWAAGIGARYFTGIGPLRVDLAFPINRREGIDDRFQFYVSLGQAF